MALELWIRRSTYDRLIALCDPDTQEYRWLKDSYFERDGPSGDRVCILCYDQAHARQIEEYAVKMLPECAIAMQRVERIDE